MNKYRVLIADDHQIVIDGFKNMLADEEAIYICNETNNINKIIPTISASNPDVLILDVNMNDINTFTLVPEIKKLHPKLKIIAFTSYNTPGLRREAVKLGINAYLTKNVDKSKLLSTIFKTIDNEKEGTDRTEKSDPKKENNIHDKFIIEKVLSKRELQVLKLVAQGYTSQQIAEKLFLSKHTVHTHRKHIVGKLNLNSVGEMVAVAYEHGLV